MLEKLIPLFRKPGLIDIFGKFARKVEAIADPFAYSAHPITAANKELYEIRKRRILDTISLTKFPDRVPVIGNGINFFPAKYAGISCAEYMYNRPSLLKANRRFMANFDLDMFFMPYLFSIGQIVTRAGIDLLRIPGRDLSSDVGYQFYEIERLKADEYGTLLQRGMPFLIDTLAPRFADLFKLKGWRLNTMETVMGIEGIQFGWFILSILNEMKARGAYTIFGGVAFPPFDVVSIAFRTAEGVARDMMKKDIREKIPIVCEKMVPWLCALFKSVNKITGNPGVWFPSERAFSLSPKQFEKYYWSSLKRMIIDLVEDGLMPFLTWESDVTHLVPFLLELPKRVARRCVFNCDMSDIFAVHKILDGHMAIAGNIPLSTMCVGTPHDVEKECERLFNVMKPGGGYLLSPALGIPDEANAENVRVMISFCKERGCY